MNKLEVVQAAYTQYANDHRARGIIGDGQADPIKGFGIGFSDRRAIQPRKNENYALVLFVDPDITDDDLNALPQKMKLPKKDVPQFANRADLPDIIKVKIRYEKKRLSLLQATAVRAPMPANGIAGGDGLFANNVLIGTAGYILVSGGKNHLISNKHVLASAGLGNGVHNANGIKVGTVSELSLIADSAMAIMDPGAVFSKDVPGIGTPTSIRGGLDLSEISQKRGVSTGVTEFRIKWKGNYNGVPTVVGVHVNGANVATVGSGDSGSVLISQNTEIMGLVYAGATPVGQGPNGDLYSEIFAMDISYAFQNVQLP